MDARNVEDELIAILYCLKDDVAQEIQSCVRYLSLEVPTRADTERLLNCLGNALKPLATCLTKPMSLEFKGSRSLYVRDETMYHTKGQLLVSTEHRGCVRIFYL